MKYVVYCRKSTEAEDRQVLSIDSQEAEIRRAFDNRPEIEIAAVYREARSAKAPGRPVFNALLKCIERGEAAGIIAWHPDRLARNSIDGGQIIYLLDRQKLRDLKFATFTFENNPQGKFMLAITFGYSKYYVDSLSENVKRGNRAKIEKGWRPGRAPIGYLNDKTNKTIVPDPDHFPYVRQMFELLLAGRPVGEIVRIATDDWGYRTPSHKRHGGGVLRLSTAYHLLTSPFYAGCFLWGGQLHRGRHEPVVTWTEFERVQELLGRPTRPRQKRHSFAYTGMIRCGACGLQVTAEHKVNRFGSRYLYYHCTRKHRVPACTQPSIEIRALEAQVRSFLRSITLSRAIHEWAVKQVETVRSNRTSERGFHRDGLARTMNATQTQLSNLTDLRIRSLIDDEEFAEKRCALQRDLIRLEDRLRASDKPVDALEPQKLFLMFSNRAVSWFDSGDVQVRRTILQIVSSNLSLKDKRLSIQAKKPFRSEGSQGTIPTLRGQLDDVRTLRIGTFPSQRGELDDVRTSRVGKREVLRWMEEVRKLAEEKDEELLKTVELIRGVDRQMEAPTEEELAA